MTVSVIMDSAVGRYLVTQNVFLVCHVNISDQYQTLRGYSRCAYDLLIFVCVIY